VVTMRAIGGEAGDGSSACTNSGADRATNLGADQSSAYGASTDELGFGVMTVVMGASLRDGIFMRFLSLDSGGKRKNCAEGKKGRCKFNSLDSVHGMVRSFRGLVSASYPTQHAMPRFEAADAPIKQISGATTCRVLAAGIGYWHAFVPQPELFVPLLAYSSGHGGLNSR
jgi:hypothetical protein